MQARLPPAPAGQEPGSRLRVAMLAPPWISIPPTGYGGIETVVDTLCAALVRRGHAVTLYAAAGSRSAATVVEIGDETLPLEIGKAMPEADHVASALRHIERAARSGRAFDVIHDHNDAVTVAFADRVGPPVVHTVHGPFTPAVASFHRRHAGAAMLVGLTQAQLRAAPPNAWVHGAIANPLRIEDWRFSANGRGYLLWLGRFSPDKGPDRAIRVARACKRPLILAGPIQRGQEAFFRSEIEPHVDGERVRYVGEVGGALKQRLLGEADALLMPIRWPEPFGMVMVEAMACGTPVVAFGEGSAPEVVRDGVGGWVVSDEEEMVQATTMLASLDRHACRAWAADLCDADGVAAAYETAYRSAIASRAARSVSAGRSWMPAPAA